MDKKFDFSILSENQLFGDNRLKIFDKIGTGASMTDYTVALGGAVMHGFYTNEGCSIENRTGIYLVKQDDSSQYSYVNYDGLLNNQIQTSFGVRITVPYSQIKDFCSNKIRRNDGVLEVQFGDYPSTIVSLEKNKVLKRAEQYNYNSLVKLSSKYTVNTLQYMDYGQDVKSQTNNKYMYDNECYIKTNINSNNSIVLSNFEEYLNGEMIWISVEPVQWFVDEENDLAISKKLLFVGNDCNVTMDFIKNIFSKEVIQNINFQSDTLSFDNKITLIKNSDSFVNNRIMNVHSINTMKQKQTLYNEDSLVGNKIREIQKIICQEEQKILNKYNNQGENVLPHLMKSQYDYGVYLTDIDYDIDPAIGRQKELRELSKHLLIPKTGVILVGEAGVGKTAIVEGLAYRIQKNNICNLLKNKGILSVNVGELLSGCNLRGDFEKKITDLCNDLIDSKNVILFLDEMHMSLGAGSTVGNGSVDMANMLKTYISNDQIKVIGCTTNQEFEKYFSGDKAFRRRFNIIDVREPNEIVLNDILNVAINNFANKFNVKIKLSEFEIDNIIKIIINLSSRKQKYIYEPLKNPDASIKILANCFAYFAIEDIVEVKYRDFIDSIIDNDNLSLSKMEIENLLEKDIDNNVNSYKLRRQKVFTLSKKETF